VVGVGVGRGGRGGAVAARSGGGQGGVRVEGGNAALLSASPLPKPNAKRGKVVE